MPTSRTHRKVPQEIEQLQALAMRLPDNCEGSLGHVFGEIASEIASDYLRAQDKDESLLDEYQGDVSFEEIKDFAIKDAVKYIREINDRYAEYLSPERPGQKNADENDQEAMRLTQDIRKAVSHALPEILHGEDYTYDDLIGMLQACEAEVVAARARVEVLKEHTHKFNERLYCIHCGYDGAS